MKPELSRREKLCGLAGVLLALFGLGWFRLSQSLGIQAGPMRAFGQGVGSLLCRFWSLLPFPASELVWTAGPLAAVAITAVLVKKRGLSGLAAALCRLLLAGGVIFCLFSVVFLVQYSAVPLAEELNLTLDKYTTETLADVAMEVASQLNTCAEKVSRDEQGLFAPASYGELAAAVQESYRQGSMAGLYARGAGIAPKQGVLLSKAMSWLGITGYYFPITGESIVSGDLIETSLPFTIAHETAHAFGIGPEKEANFAAFLSCIESGSDELAYSALFNGYIYLNNALFRADRTLWEAVYSTLSQPVLDDLAAKSAHLQQYEGRVNDFGNSVNNAYIQATGQPEGVRSYGLMVDLIVAYYRSR